MSVFPSSVTLSSIQAGTMDTFAETIGVEFTELGADFLAAQLTVGPRHLRPGKIMNGGVSLALIETVGSVAARCAIWGQQKNTLGIQVTASHLAMALPGDRLTIRARPVHLGRTTHLWDVVIENQKGRLVSTGRLTMLVVEEFARD